MSSRPPSYASASFDSLPSFESLQYHYQPSSDGNKKRSRFASLFFSWKRSSKASLGESESEECPPPYVSAEDLELAAYQMKQFDLVFGGAAIKGV
jgi:hypothetical protein